MSRLDPPRRASASARTARPPRQGRRGAGVLARLQAEQAARDEEMLLAAAWAAFNEAAASPAPLAAPPCHEAAACASPPAERRERLTFTTPAGGVDRVVIQNWKSERGFVPIGGVELELDPGQAVTLWVNRDHPTPQPREPEEDEGARSCLAILWEDEPLIA